MRRDIRSKLKRDEASEFSDASNVFAERPWYLRLRTRPDHRTQLANETFDGQAVCADERLRPALENGGPSGQDDEPDRRLAAPSNVGRTVRCPALYLLRMFSWWELIDLAGSPLHPLGELRLVLRLLPGDRLLAEPVRATTPARTLARAA